MQFKPNKRYSHADELSRCRPTPTDAALAGNRVQHKSLAVSSLQSVPADLTDFSSEAW